MAVTIGTTIRTLRLQAGMTQDDLAERLHVTRQAVSNYERGKTNPDVGQLETMAEVFHMDLEDLIYGHVPSMDRRKKLTAAVIVQLCLLILLSVSLSLASWSRKESARLAEISWFWIFAMGILVPLITAGIAWCAAVIVLLLSTARLRIPRFLKTARWILWILFTVFLLLNLHMALMTAAETGFGPQWLRALSMDAFLVSTRHGAALYPLLIILGAVSGAVHYSGWTDR